MFSGENTVVPKVRKLSEAGVRPVRQYSVLVTMMLRFGPHCMCEQDCDYIVGKQVIPRLVSELEYNGSSSCLRYRFSSHDIYPLIIFLLVTVGQQRYSD